MRTRGALFLTVVSIYALTNAGFDVTEGQDDLRLARHIVESHTLAFADDPRGITAPGPDGRFFLSHDIGNAIALIPAVIVSRAIQPMLPGRLAGRTESFVASFMPALYAALAVVAVYDIAVVTLGVSGEAAIATALAFAFGSFLWPYARSLFDGVLTMMLLAWSFAFAGRAVRFGRARDHAVAGLLIGLAVVTRQVVAIVLPVVAVYIWRAGEHRRPGLLPAFVLPVGACVAWQAYYNVIRTGSMLMPAVALPQYAQNNTLDGNIAVGLFGFLCSPGKSMFLFSPVLVFSVLGARAFVQRHRAASAMVFASVAAYLLIHAAARNWAGEWGWGPRYSLVVLPLLMAPGAIAIERLVQRPGKMRLVGAAIVAAGLVVQLAAVTINWHYRYSYLAQSGQLSTQETIWDPARGQFADALRTAAVNIGRVLGRSASVDVVTGADPLNVVASNGVNFWWITATHAGVPWSVSILIVSAMLASFAVGIAGLAHDKF